MSSNQKKYGTVKKIKEVVEELVDKVDCQREIFKNVSKNAEIEKAVCEERSTQTEEAKPKEEAPSKEKKSNKWRKNPKLAAWIAFAAPILTYFILVFFVFYFRITKSAKC